jgi:nitroreductase
MNVRDALLARYSVRAFQDRPVDLDLVRDMLSVAARAPSGGNLQPWTVHVLAGTAIERFKAMIAARMDAGVVEQPEFNVYPPQLWEPLRARRSTAARKRFAACGLEESPETTRLMQRLNYSFFGAPVGLFFFLDRRAGPPQWGDVGIMMQSFMLLALDHGLATCPQEIWSNWPKSIAEFMNIPEGLMLYSGMSLGYADEQAAINSFRTEREPLQDFSHFHVD